MHREEDNEGEEIGKCMDLPYRYIRLLISGEHLKNEKMRRLQIQI